MHFIIINLAHAAWNIKTLFVSVCLSFGRSVRAYEWQ